MVMDVHSARAKPPPASSVGASRLKKTTSAEESAPSAALSQGLSETTRSREPIDDIQRGCSPLAATFVCAPRGRSKRRGTVGQSSQMATPHTSVDATMRLVIIIPYCSVCASTLVLSFFYPLRDDMTE